MSSLFYWTDKQWFNDRIYKEEWNYIIKNIYEIIDRNSIIWDPVKNISNQTEHGSEVVKYHWRIIWEYSQYKVWKEYNESERKHRHYLNVLIAKYITGRANNKDNKWENMFLSDSEGFTEDMIQVI